MRRLGSIVLGLACVGIGAAACIRSVGPLPLRIETAGVRYEDFVIQPVQEYGRLHSSEMVTMEPLVVASQADLTIPRFTAGPTFTTLLVSSHHPEFVYTFTGDSVTGWPITLLPLRPQRWGEFREEHGKISLRVVESHLQHLLLSYVPAFEEGEERARLRGYLPGLAQLVEGADWLPGDAGARWPTEADGRAELRGILQQISELMR